MAGVVAECDRGAVGGANASVRGQHQVLLRAQLFGFPTHAGVLRPTEQVAGGPLAEYLRSEGQAAGWARGARGDVVQSGVVGIERVAHETFLGSARKPRSR